MTLAGRMALDELRRSGEVDPRLPWGGRSPRALTKAHERFRLESRGDDADPDFDDAVLDEQYQRFLHGS